MLITSLSLPRTGSVWWAHYIQKIYSGSIILHETFNYMIYRNLDKNGKHVFSETYRPGYWWLSPDSEYKEIIQVKAERDISDTELFDRWMKFIRKTDKCVICRNHIIPTNEKHLEFIAENSAKVYYTFREDIQQQLASLAIGKHTMEFVVFSDSRSYQYEKFTSSIISLPIMEDFCTRIASANYLIEKYFPDCTRVKYEDMPFHTITNGMPKKQNLSAFDRLCEEDKNTIRKLVEKL